MATAGAMPEMFVDIGLFHALKKLAGRRRRGFDVTSLAFGVDGVKGERGLAGTADASDDSDFVMGDYRR